jgi:Na+-driven multidrug efflux pump
VRWSKSGGNDRTARLLSSPEVEEEEAVNTRGAAAIIREYLRASGSMVVRSLLLSTSVWSLGVAAANLGSAALGAHAVVLQLWMVTSFVSDGFADAGTMLGAKMLGEKQYDRMMRLCDRLVAYGVVTGVCCGLGLWALESTCVRLYFPSSSGQSRDEARLLSQVWPLLCGMQVINSAVFVFDGLIYATKSFEYVRNVMLSGCIGVFLPLFAVTFVEEHTLVWIWISKAVLNTWRLLWAVRLIHVKFRRAWVRGGGDRCV